MIDFDDLAEKHDGFYSPRFSIAIDDREITEFDGQVTGLSVQTSLSEANRASFGLEGAFDYEAAEFAGIDWEWWETGKRLDVKLGYGDVDSLAWVFHGAIDSLQPNFSAGGGATVQVSAQDPRKELMAREADDSWDGMTVGEIVDDVVSGSGAYDFPDRDVEGVSATGEDRLQGADLGGVSPGDLDPDDVVQDDESHYDVLTRIATIYGYELFFRGGTFHFRRPRRNAEPRLELEYGRSLRSFSPHMPGERQDVGEVIVTDSEGTSTDPITGTATRPGGETTVERTARVASRVEADARAHAILHRLELGPTNKAEVLGLPDLRIGDPVSITGLGAFSGTYYVEEADHSLGSSGYTTSITVRNVEP